jgi:hypothetical protein
MRAFQRLFPSLREATFDKDLAKSVKSQSLRQGIEGIFLIPRWELLGKSYNEALFEVWKKIHQYQSFNSYLGDKEKILEPVGEEFLREHPVKAEAMTAKADIQNQGFLVLTAQPMPEPYLPETRVSVFNRRFPLGLFEISCIVIGFLPVVSHLLTAHRIIAAGDMYSPIGAGFDYHPMLVMKGAWVKVAWSNTSWKNLFYGEGMTEIIYGIPPSEL